MNEKDMKAVRTAVDLSIENVATNIALYATLKKAGIVIDETFFESEKERLTKELKKDIYEELNK